MNERKLITYGTVLGAYHPKISNASRFASVMLHISPYVSLSGKDSVCLLNIFSKSTGQYLQCEETLRNLFNAGLNYDMKFGFG